MDRILTPLQALEALLAACEESLDYRHEFRRAMSDAHAAIANAAPALHGSVNLGAPLEVGDEDCELSFRDLFGEPNPSVIDNTVLEAARAIAATDGAIVLRDEVAHG